MIFHEIQHQYDAIEQCVRYLDEKMDALRTFLAEISFQYVLFLGSGSSFSVAKSMADAVNMRFGRPACAVNAGDAAVHTDRYIILARQALIVPISRSGQTSELLLALRALRKCSAHIHTIRETDYMELALVGTKGVFVQEDAPDAHKQFTSFFFNGRIEIVPDLEHLFHSNRIVKLSVSTGSDGSNEARGMERMREFEDRFSLALSGDGWLDLTKKGVGKGSGFVKLCSYYHIGLDETMVFGDYLNDLEMLMRSPNSYAMANAHPKVREACAHVTQFSNNEDGVVRELIRLFRLS